MERTAMVAAQILTEIYEESFGRNGFDQFRIQWSQLRDICAVRKLDSPYLDEVTDELNELGYSLARFDDFILVMKEGDCGEVRNVPGRVVEKYLPRDADNPEMGEETEDSELEDD